MILKKIIFRGTDKISYVVHKHGVRANTCDDEIYSCNFIFAFKQILKFLNCHTRSNNLPKYRSDTTLYRENHMQSMNAQVGPNTSPMKIYGKTPLKNLNKTWELKYCLEGNIISKDYYRLFYFYKSQILFRFTLNFWPPWFPGTKHSTISKEHQMLIFTRYEITFVVVVA